MPQRVLILFAHPAVRKSRLNKPMRDAVANLPGVTLHDLYETYPGFHIDVEREQALLLAHDVIVFQHPLYWYSVPALLKEWMDAVLEIGFAYGAGGTKLKGKTLHQAITTGGAHEAYQPTGYNRYTITELLRPFEQTATLCRMHYLAPFLVQGVARMGMTDIAAAAARYKEHIQSLVDAHEQP